MSSTEIFLPNEIIRLILEYCQTPRDYLSQSLINQQWYCEAQTLKSHMKTRFSRQITSLNRRFIIWHYDIRVTVVGYNSQIERHGREECVQTYHRVGGPSESVYYLERTWHQGRLQGLEIVREINTVWYDNDYQRSNQTRSQLSLHPYDGLAAVDSIRNCIQPAANDSLPDNCDFLGRIVFQHQWTSGSIEDSQQLIRNISSDDLDNLYSYLHEFDLTTVKPL